MDFISRNGSICVDKLIAFENLKHDLQFVANRINRDLGLLGHENRSVRGEYRSYYKTSEQVDIVGKIYKDDIDFLNYRFEQ
mgnify:FL=1